MPVYGFEITEEKDRLIKGKGKEKQVRIPDDQMIRYRIQISDYQIKT